MSHDRSVDAAPWKSLFLSHLEKQGASPEFYLATVNHESQPRLRACIHRGFWAGLPENSHNQMPKNPKVYDTDCPAFTTDARMGKVFDIFATGKGRGTLEQSRAGTGGGGPVEALYWIKDVKVQWRLRGRCWIIAADDLEHEGEGDMQNSGTVTMKAVLQRYMRKTGQAGDWSWKREVENFFGNLSPVMRGSFKNPPPGQPVQEGSGPGEKLGQVANLLQEDDLARRNFRVAVITPEEVEHLDLTELENQQRRIWRLVGDGQDEGISEWEEIVTWP